MTDADRRQDWYTARVVAMVAATNSKREKYDPVKWMAGGGDIKRQARERAAAARPLTGEEIMARFKALGVPVIDKRAVT